MENKPEPLVVLALLLGRHVYIELDGKRHLVQVTTLLHNRWMEGSVIESPHYKPNQCVAFVPNQIVEVLDEAIPATPKTTKEFVDSKGTSKTDSHPF